MVYHQSSEGDDSLNFSIEMPADFFSSDEDDGDDAASSVDKQQPIVLDTPCKVPLSVLYNMQDVLCIGAISSACDHIIPMCHICLGSSAYIHIISRLQGLSLASWTLMQSWKSAF